MVYCWCDGSDPAFIERKKQYLAMESEMPGEGEAGEYRFSDNEELRYSLRSLAKFVPWIRHVYIVTDRQQPRWLDASCDKLTVVDHSEILPPALIPMFESATIERYLAEIPGLSEHFLYGNDDMFFGRPLAPSFFFSAEGRPRVYVKHYERYREVKDEADFRRKYEDSPTWMDTNLNSWKLLYENYHRHEFYVLAHTIDAYTKTLFREVLRRYRSAFDANDPLRFRTEYDISRNIFGLDMAYSGKADMEVIEKPGFWQKHIHKSANYHWKCYCGSENGKTRKEIRRFEPELFCVNAESHASAEEKRAMRAFYEELFPEPSPFERA